MFFAFGQWDIYILEETTNHNRMERTVTRRTVLATVGIGIGVSLAGCNAFDDTSRDDATDADENGDDIDANGNDVEDNGDDDPDERDPVSATRLIIESGERHTLASASENRYTGIEIHPGGQLQFEPSAVLTLEG